MKQSITKGYGVSGVQVTLNINEVIEIQHIASEWKVAIEKTNKECEKIELPFTMVLNITNFLHNVLTNTESTEPTAFMNPEDFKRQQEERNK